MSVLPYCLPWHIVQILPVPTLKPLIWVGSALDELRKFPELAQKHIGQALLNAQWGGKAIDARPLKGFAGASVIEIVEDCEGDTYRAIYTERFEEAIYVLHAFQKKSKSGIATPVREIKLIEQRLKRAKHLHDSLVKH